MIRCLAVPEIDGTLEVSRGKPWNAAQPCPPGHTLMRINEADGTWTIEVLGDDSLPEDRP